MDYIAGFHIKQYKSYCGFLCYTDIILIEINSELSSQYLKIGGVKTTDVFYSPKQFQLVLPPKMPIRPIKDTGWPVLIPAYSAP